MDTNRVLLLHADDFADRLVNGELSEEQIHDDVKLLIVAGTFAAGLSYFSSEPCFVE